MLTAQATLDALTRYDISESNLSAWETALGLEIPVDGNGQKVYSPHHINLFKNVKKHLALGRTLAQIKSIISLPPENDAIPVNTTPAAEKVITPSKESGQRRSDAKPYASAPSKPAVTPTAAAKAAVPPELFPKAETHIQSEQKSTQAPANTAPGVPVIKERLPKNSPYSQASQRQSRNNNGATEVVELVKKLTAEKDHLYQKLLETEKLNSHLYSANNLYHRRVKDLEQSMDAMHKQLPFDQNVKLMDDKAKLHRQLIDAEKKLSERETELKQAQQAILELNQAMARLNIRLQEAHQPFDAAVFCGDWMENGRLAEIVYDNFGINVEPERVRLFRVSKTPDRIFGNTAVITTNYQYETNPQWRRQETLVATFLPDQSLEGEVTAEYILDDVPVAKALYKVRCKRNS